MTTVGTAGGATAGSTAGGSMTAGSMTAGSMMGSMVMPTAPGLQPSTLWLLGLLAVGGRAALDLTVGGEAGELWQRTMEVLTPAVIGAVALQFSAGDPPRTPWLVLCVAMSLIPVVRLLSWFQARLGDIAVAHLVLIVGNVLLVASIIGFARVLGSSELLSDRTREDRSRAFIVVGLLVLAALATLVFNTFELALRGMPATPGAWIAAAATIVSTLCDSLVFGGGLYLVWLLRPLIGGSLARPYLLIAVGAGAFLVVDVFLVVAGATTQTDLIASGLRTLLPKWIGCLAFTGFALAAASQVALLLSARRRRLR